MYKKNYGQHNICSSNNNISLKFLTNILRILVSIEICIKKMQT